MIASLLRSLAEVILFLAALLCAALERAWGLRWPVFWMATMLGIWRWAHQ